MGNFLSEIPQLKELVDKGYNIFIETGTYEGSTPLFLVGHGLFKEIHTIELSPYHYLYSAENIKRFFNNERRFKPDMDFIVKQKINEPIDHPLKYGNVTCYLGDSPQILTNIVSTNLDTKFIIWLDGHYSGGVTAISKEFGECPILMEIESLNKLHHPPIIIVDDADCFGLDKSTHSLTGSIEDYKSKTWSNYPTLIQLFNKIKTIHSSYEMEIFGEKNWGNTKLIFRPKKILT